MFTLEVKFFLCDQVGFLRTVSLVIFALNIIRFVVPAGLIIFTTVDLIKNVIKPDEKEGMKTIRKRIIAAIIVFIIPTVIGIIFNLIDSVFDNIYDTKYSVSRCYINANSTCISKVERNKDCQDLVDVYFETNGKKSLTDAQKDVVNKCKNDNAKYRLDSSCNITSLSEEE